MVLLRRQGPLVDRHRQQRAGVIASRRQSPFFIEMPLFTLDGAPETTDEEMPGN